MSFTDLAKQHATFATGHVLGRSIEYRAHGKATWTTFTGRVRPGRDEFGNVVANTLEVFASKEFVTGASEGHDLFRLTDEKTPGEWWPVYRLTKIDGPDKVSGLYHLRCVQ